MDLFNGEIARVLIISHDGQAYSPLYCIRLLHGLRRGEVTDETRRVLQQKVIDSSDQRHVEGRAKQPETAATKLFSNNKYVFEPA